MHDLNTRPHTRPSLHRLPLFPFFLAFLTSHLRLRLHLRLLSYPPPRAPPLSPSSSHPKDASLSEEQKVQMVEEAVGLGQIEELIKMAEEDLALIPQYAEWKLWEE